MVLWRASFTIGMHANGIKKFITIVILYIYIYIYIYIDRYKRNVKV